MSTPNERIPLTPGQELPEWTLESIDDKDVPIVSDFLGKPLIILFINLGCPGCKGRAVPFANRLLVELRDRLNVLCIHSNFKGEDFSNEEIREESEALFMRFPVFRDQELSKTFDLYCALGTPHWVIVDREGKVVDTIFGSDPNRALLRIDYHLESLLNEQA